MYTVAQAKELIKLARKVIENEFQVDKIELELPEKFKEKRGVFVTIYHKEELRGCIGHPYPTMPLRDAVIDAAKSAAFDDPRFADIKKEELEDIRIELSVLTLPQETKPENIEIGKDGIIGTYKEHSGLLLPQVATEYKMSQEEFLDALCQKAFLPKGTWKNPDFKLFKFQAQIFREDKEMKVKRVD